jgi:hypothetical protein
MIGVTVRIVKVVSEPKPTRWIRCLAEDEEGDFMVLIRKECVRIAGAGGKQQRKR